MRRAIIPNNSNLVIKSLAGVSGSRIFQFCAKIHAHIGKLKRPMMRIGSASSKNPMWAINIRIVASHFNLILTLIDGVLSQGFVNSVIADIPGCEISENIAFSG